MSDDYGNAFLPPPDEPIGRRAEIDWPGDSVPEDPALITGGFATELLDARAGVEEALRSQAPRRRNPIRTQEDLTEALNLQGVGIGVAPSDGLRTVVPGQPVLTVYVAQPRSGEYVRELVVDELQVRSAASNSVAVNAVSTGLITASSHSFRWRPAPGGISASHKFGNVGTMGCLAVGRNPPRDQQLLIVSNNHVFARTNDAVYGDFIIQQAVDDGGDITADAIAIVESWVPLKFDGSINFVDAATAWAYPTLVQSGQLIVGSTGPGIYATSTLPTAASVGMYVAKSGRTTEFTQAQVAEVGAAHWVNYLNWTQQAFFSGSIAVNSFSQPGDSGSLVWTGVDRNPVGLLFAGGSGQRTFLNNIQNVLSSLDIRLVP
jgi:hypothetical protein